MTEKTEAFALFDTFPLKLVDGSGKQVETKFRTLSTVEMYKFIALGEQIAKAQEAGEVVTPEEQMEPYAYLFRTTISDEKVVQMLLDCSVKTMRKVAILIQKKSTLDEDEAKN